MLLRCAGLSVDFESPEGCVSALADISFTTGEEEFVTLVGPSGCGKTTLLRALAGMIHPTRGIVERITAPDEDSRSPVLVRQEHSLFPWMTVLDNATFGLEMCGLGKAERDSLAIAMLERFGLAGRERAWPHQLSKGMKQRVAIVRAFLTSSSVLLMDEPFASLDCQTRLMAQRELAAHWQQDRRTVIFVTHDVEEAILLSDRILVLSHAPGTIVAEWEVPAPRPRDPLESCEALLDLKGRIFAELELAGHRARAAYAG